MILLDGKKTSNDIKEEIRIEVDENIYEATFCPGNSEVGYDIGGLTNGVRADGSSDR